MKENKLFSQSNDGALELIHCLAATKNRGKLNEIRKLFEEESVAVKLYCLPDFGISEDAPESGHTFLENATEKALFYGKLIAEKIDSIGNVNHLYIVGDDSGLSVEALDGAPGVYSARYAGPQANDDDNTAKLLKQLEGVSNRKAKFMTVLSLVLNNKVIASFSGEVEGIIIDEKRGNNGFGYDPVFYYPPLQKTFAELTTEEKNRISHRSRAFRQLKDYFKENV